MKIEQREKPDALDTDKLDDRKAEVMVALKNLNDVCEKYNVTAYAGIVFDPKNYVDMIRLTTVPDKLANEYEFLVEIISKYLDKTSEGKFAVFSIKPPAGENKL